MRLYFTEYAASAKYGIRPLQFAAVIGAIVIGAVLRVLSGVPLLNIAVWCGAIALGEATIVAINHAFLVRQPPDSDLRKWALAKAALAGLGGFSWCLGQILLHVDGQALTAIVPPWTIMMYCCGAVWAGAFYAPALFAMILTSAVPAALWLLTGQGVEVVTGICLLLATPYFMFLGHSASLRYRAAVIDKIDIALLLDKQRADSARIEQLSAERARFFGAASHDMRQPLHAMGLYLALLRDNPDDGEREELIDSISQCAVGLDMQFNAILGVSDTDNLVRKANPRPCPLQIIFDNIAVQARATASVGGLTFRVARTSVWANIEPDILQRVLGNLVANALRYTQAGGVLVGARRRGANIAILVIDTGIGIAPEHRDKIFQDFFQIDNPERNSARGFGLGLGIVQRLCAGMEWPLEVRSRPGHGTCFAVIVPAAAPVVLAPKAPAPRQSASRLEGRRALVVDDDERVLDAMRRMFDRWGVEAQFCRTADEAFAALAASDPGAPFHLLADYRLGGEINGLELALEARRLHGDCILAAIVTGEADQALEAQVEAHGLVILRKPVQPVRLRALLAR